MKKLKKLILRKEIIANLDSNEMNSLKGGESYVAVACLTEALEEETFFGTGYYDTCCKCPEEETPKEDPPTGRDNTCPDRCCNYGCCETVNC